MPKSVLFVIFLLLAALGASLTLVTGEASPMRSVAAENLPGEVADGEAPEASEAAEGDEQPGEAKAEEEASEGVVPELPAELAVLQDAEAGAAERLGAAKVLLTGLEGVEGQPALLTQLEGMETALAADANLAMPDDFVDAVAALVQGAAGD